MDEPLFLTLEEGRQLQAYLPFLNLRKSA